MTPCKPIAPARANIKLVSLTNAREHWATKASRAAEQRAAGRFLAHNAMLNCEWKGCKKMLVQITRIGPRPLDSDNLASSAKHLRDGIADYFGIDDGSSWYEWRYEQRKGRPKEYAVEVTLEVVR